MEIKKVVEVSTINVVRELVEASAEEQAEFFNLFAEELNDASILDVAYEKQCNSIRECLNKFTIDFFRNIASGEEKSCKEEELSIEEVCYKASSKQDLLEMANIIGADRLGSCFDFDIGYPIIFFGEGEFLNVDNTNLKQVSKEEYINLLEKQTA